MYLLLATIIYTGLVLIFKVPSFGYGLFYLVTIMALKTANVRDKKQIFNRYPVKNYMNKNAVYEVLSLGIVILPDFFISYTPDPRVEMEGIILGSIFIILMFWIILQFMFLGIIGIIAKKEINEKQHIIHPLKLNG